ncbi:MAG: DUF429 domain-containing protein [Bacteroidia bacterium]|nr:DUF429 domain-containing protein [Bacteroidia bacterium]GIV23538.1 MAG: hypothetical protein KatS3mg025_1197 [Bacteroidia bacterium]
MWAGVDLAASPKRPSGVAVGEMWSTVQVHTCYTDEEIIASLVQACMVWIDAPLTEGKGPFRDCDRLLMQRGITLLPLSWPAMRQLYARALRLQAQLPHMPFRETFPWAFYRALSQGHVSGPTGRRAINKKDTSPLAEWAKGLGFKGEPRSVHEWDALTCWAMGTLAPEELLVLEGTEGGLWVPRAVFPPLSPSGGGYI